jgi:predicted transcriptional regulator
MAKIQYADIDVTGQQPFSRPRSLPLLYDLEMAARTRRKVGRRTSVETAEHYRALAKKLLVERYGDNQERFAEALEMSQGAVSTLVTGKGGVGVAMIESLERLAGSSAAAGAIRRGLEEPYPGRRIVIELARGEGVSESVLRALGAVIPPSVEDPGEDYWQERLLDIEARRKGIAGRLGK